MAPTVRFDDLTPASARSFALSGYRGEVVAHAPAEVIPALHRVADHAAAGMWTGGFVAYEAGPGLDPALGVHGGTRHGAMPDLPLVWFGIFETAVDVDPPSATSHPPTDYSIGPWIADTDRPEYDAVIRSIRDHIAEGDTYQVNHTYRLRSDFRGDPAALYADLVMAQRGSGGACIATDRFQILSASPERFFTASDGIIRVRPMKGTIGRGRWPDEDAARRDRLAASDKDRAENLMIVDLLRSDLGRIAEFGTVNVDQLLAVERYETVWQLTSQISARLRPGQGLVEIFSALFPSGSVTGAPKVRTSEIIADLERSQRGVYCGAIGWVAPADGAHLTAGFNVGIRTVVIDADAQLAEYGTGGGITWDSSAEDEYEEAQLKAELLVARRPDFHLIETMRWDRDQGLWWLEEHLDRLAASAGYFGYSLDRVIACKVLDDATSEAGPGPRRVRLELSRSGVVTAIVATERLRDFSWGPEEGTPPVPVAMSNQPVSSRDIFLFHKTTHRGVFESASAAHPDATDVLLSNERGELTESTVANVAVLVDEQWYTPPLDSGCLPGVFRKVLLDAGSISERVLTRTDVRRGGGLALINSVRGWRRADLVGLLD